MNDQQLDWLTQSLDRLNATVTQNNELLAAILQLLQGTFWTCGCGHVNAPTHVLCARCGRTPGGL